MNYLDFDFNELAIKIHKNARNKGFWDKHRNEGELFMLIISELGEALESDRKGKNADLVAFDIAIADYFQGETIDLNDKFHRVAWAERFRWYIKDTFQDEIADTVIRILDYAAYDCLDIDLFKWEQLGDFTAEENIGETLMNVVASIHYAYRLVEERKELHINSALLQLFHLSRHLNFDLIRHIKLKCDYNETREKLHSKAY